MAIFIWDCPALRIKADDVQGNRESHPPAHGSTREKSKVAVGAECQACYLPVGAMLRYGAATEGHSYIAYDSQAKKLVADPSAIGTLDFKLIEVWPKAASARIPEYLPPAVEKAFQQAETAQSLPDLEDAAATMYRRALDVGLKIAFPEIKGDLYKRIEALVAAHIFPPSIGEWAHEIRLIGNDGAHDLEGARKEDLAAARDFVDAVMRYSFLFQR